ncbi:ROK family protein [Jiella mangrovi]|uniref:ROK family protein n=1 Tax=Jiella mangrovi TaxID=2821407 RepID=A0ABS4BI15_9HYPH|nr:ROK family protein [Jiella mangrovi]MBP0615816.1 ROK family protein [Jiella mangrovi]
MSARIRSGAIDLGGTKIETRLFGPDLQTLELRRKATPTESFEALVEGLSGEIAWLMETASDPRLPIGLAIPGLLDETTGECFSSNLPISGRHLAPALSERFGRRFTLAQDGKAFAYSEAMGGAGEGFQRVVGLVLGTGVGGGVCDLTFNPVEATALEIGHVGMPARALAANGLPLWRCGCGKLGCIECYVAGSALSRLSDFMTGERIDGAAIAARADAGDGPAKAVLDAWLALVGECLLTIQITLDPDCIVIGGGASKMPRIIERLEPALAALQLGMKPPPALRLARHGDSSGVRGMALLALGAFFRDDGSP